MKKAITHPHTCIVAELDESTEAWVGNIRNKLDSNYDMMPKEITLCGSSGLGSISPGQRLADVIEEISNVIKAARQKIGKDDTFSFQPKVHTFPGTQIHVLLPEPSNIFYILHEKLKESKIEFEKSEREFGPHCTVYHGMFLEKLLEPDEVEKRRVKVRNFFESFESHKQLATIKSIALYECDLSDPREPYIKKIADVPFTLI